MTEALPCFLDIEASGLEPGSFPVEIAWSLRDGTINGALVRPHPEFDMDSWDPRAEELHGLSIDYLEQHGEDAGVIISRLRAGTQGAPMYCDAIAFDPHWLEILWMVSGAWIARGDYPRLLAAYELFSDVSEAPIQAMERLREAISRDDRSLRPHRAKDDVRALLTAYLMRKKNPG
ncbi:hypothetical protein QWY84_16785 [Aquisalimonas lutea]|uniref:hypothetical protein n=1 Tax=Aquisalimonas lutea TaxID=1327750 RepID=UPI0025B43DBB|nr:hypothetical protein [Aquisalimonas lutea]MDN3519273.1 hypothetical protein [Aquisalimonas lutea]